MTKRFQFTRLIKKYSVPFSIEKKGVKFLNEIGEWQETGTEWVPATGALIPLGARQIEQSGGTLTEADRTLYYMGELLENGTRIEHNGQLYHILRYIPYEQYADFNSYTVKHVSAFDKVVT